MPRPPKKHNIAYETKNKTNLISYQNNFEKKMEIYNIIVF